MISYYLCTSLLQGLPPIRPQKKCGSLGHQYIDTPVHNPAFRATKEQNETKIFTNKIKANETN